ncbi:MAG: sulfotransferase family protein [Cyclobacteriaceae bacterium]
MDFKLPTKKGRKVQQKAKRELFKATKKVSQNLQPNEDDKPNKLFIMGCQRSGTTMMLRILENDWQSRVYGELSKFTVNPPENIRLISLPKIKQKINRLPASLVVLKPLVESHRAHELLEFFPQSKAIWMYRHYKDVAASNLKNFGEDNGVRDLSVIAKAEKNNWRSAGVSDEVRALVSHYYREDMSNFDAAALFWYARNSLFFEQDLANHPKVRMYRYSDLVMEPDVELRALYDFIGLPYPEHIADYEISRKSVGKGQEISLDPEIEAHCQAMLNRLDEAYQKQNGVPHGHEV